MEISSQAAQEWAEGSTTRAGSPERTVKPHECAGSKVCSACGTRKPLDSFDTTDGYHRNQCRRCRQTSRNKRYALIPEVRETRLQVNGRWRVRFPDIKANCDAVNFRSRYLRDKAKYLAKFVARREWKAKAMPKWADRKKMEAIYVLAREMTLATGIKHEVDHVIPLKSDKVCGLHTEANLRIMTRVANRRKHNKLDQDIV